MPLQNNTTPMPEDPVHRRRELREILQDNIARLLYDSAFLGDGPQYDDLDPAIRIAWQEDARAAQRMTDPIVRDALVEIIASDLAHDRGLDWPELTAVGIAADPNWTPDELMQQLTLHRIETRQRFRHMGRVAIASLLRHLRNGASVRYPHVDEEVVRAAHAQMAEDEIQRMVLKPKPTLRGIDGGKS